MNDPLSAERAACLIKELLILLYRRHSHRFPIPDKPVQESIYQVQKYSDQNFAQDIKIKELAEKFYINFYYSLFFDLIISTKANTALIKHHTAQILTSL